MATSRPDFSRCRAILVGISEYEHLSDVPAAVNSLARMREVLTSALCGWPRDRVSVFANEQSPGDLPDRITELYQDTEEVALFYYVGHGQVAATPGGDTLCLGLTGSRVDPSRRKSTSLAFEDVAYALWHSPAETKIVILDCCYAGLAGRLADTEVLDLTRAAGAYTLAASGEFATAWYETGGGLGRPQTYFTKYLLDVVENGIPQEGPHLSLESIFRRAAGLLVCDGKPQPTSTAIHHASQLVFASNHAYVNKPNLTISQSVYDRIVAHARVGYPSVVCGIGMGPDGSDRVARVLPITNRAAAEPDRYALEPETLWEMDSHELVSMWRQAEANGEEPDRKSVV